MSNPNRLLIALACLLAGCGSKQADTPEHVLFVLVDTLRADHMGTYGYQRRTTPFLNQFTKQAVVFDDAVAQSSWTSPSMVSMFTGRTVNGEALKPPADIPVITELFHNAGWKTAAFVRNRLISNPENGFNRGFDRFEPAEGFSQLRQYLASTAGTKSFTYAHFVTPHDPYAPNKEYHHFVGKKNAIAKEQLTHYRKLGKSEEREMTQADLRKIRRGVNGYDDDVLLWDSVMRTLVDVLESTGQLESTLIVIAADHGEGLWTRKSFDFARDPGEGWSADFKMTHGNQLYQELIHVPLIIRVPGMAGRHVSGVASNVDIFPTLAELCDLPLPEGLSGSSLVPRMNQEEPKSEHFALSTTRYLYAVKGNRYKLIEPTKLGLSEDLTASLFDLENDPMERNNIIDRKPEVAAKLRSVLAQKRATSILAEGSYLELSEANKAAMKALGYTE